MDEFQSYRAYQARKQEWMKRHSRREKIDMTCIVVALLVVIYIAAQAVRAAYNAGLFNRLF
jgi:hypothetical protein